MCCRFSFLCCKVQMAFGILAVSLRIGRCVSYFFQRHAEEVASMDEIRADQVLSQSSEVQQEQINRWLHDSSQQATRYSSLSCSSLSA